MTSSVALDGGIRQVSVNLHNTGFGIKTGDFDVPRLWFARTDSYARYDREAGVLDVVERPHSVPGSTRWSPRLWLDLPQGYRERRIDEVEISARGYTEVHGITVGDLLVSSWDKVELVGVHVGNVCLARAVRGDVSAARVTAPENTDPARQPSVELIALSGIVTVTESSGSWRLAAREIRSAGAYGPQQASLLTPLHQPQPIRI